MTKRPTTEEIVELLKQPGFRRPPDEAPPSTDPIRPTPMVLSVEEIEPYDRNPRRTANTEYEAIRESIRAVGMDQTLTVTRRPGAKRYMIGAGGNTRLLAVQELWRETGDERFKEVNVLFVPWRSDADTLVAHLRENDLRGALTLVDRAFAIRELRAMLEAEKEEQLSLRALSEALKERGYKVGIAMLSTYDYVVDFLHPAIPTALAAGMGRPQIERVQALERAFLATWEALGVPDQDTGRVIYREVLARHDGERLDLERIRMDLHAELSVSADIPAGRAALLLGAALDGRDVADLVARHPVEDAFGDEDEAGDAAPGESAPPPQEHREPAPRETSSAKAARREGPPPQPPGPPEPEPDAGRPTAREAPPAPAPSISDGCPLPLEPPVPPARKVDPRNTRGALLWGDKPIVRHDPDGWITLLNVDLGDDLSYTVEPLMPYRERAADIAERIAEAGNLPEDCVIRLPRNGAGYIVGPPRLDYRATDVRKIDAERRRAAYWWQLATVAEQFAPFNQVAEYLRTASSYFLVGCEVGVRADCQGHQWWCYWHFHALNGGYTDAGRLPPANGPDMATLFYADLTDELLDAWTELLKLYRVIRTTLGGTVWMDWRKAEGPEGIERWLERHERERRKGDNT